MESAVIYARYSSDRQNETSIDAQIRACSDYAKTKGYSITRKYVDEAISGKGDFTGKRDKYQQMLRDADKGLFDIILVHKYDRVARNLNEHVKLDERLTKSHIRLIAIAQDFGKTPESILMKSFMWGLTQYYSENLAEETRKGLKEVAIQGKHTGGCPPFGYDVIKEGKNKGQYIINPVEAHYVKQLFLSTVEKRGYKDILEEMSEKGIKGKRGRTIRNTQVHEILRNEKYTGTLLFSVTEEKDRAKRRSKPNAVRVEGALPVIIERPLFEEVQKIMASRKQVGRKNNYLCSGIVYCRCGAKMHGSISKNKGHEYRRFACSAKCGAPSVKMDDIDRVAIAYLKDLLSPENQIAIAEALQLYKRSNSDFIKVFNQATAADIQEREKKYDNLKENLMSGVLPPEIVADLGAELKTLQAEIEALKNQEPPKDYTVPYVVSWLNSIKEAPDEKAVKMLIKGIHVQDNIEYVCTSTLNDLLSEQKNPTTVEKSVVGNSGCGGRI